ncbi:hypothetical protein MMSR116_23835 [Methylobacterium mesophilicum SR1.6/6]|uniref:Uncharacterized protein n=1 Tax=Methylobacterium mesophilicum SR1.6/6 TaxID=908290 RepID=A0A6B9FPS3_9HYPH|nr:hypothetical protein MMSR116_23835 [Methylobacterium mesophilicum SR1.6/6]
MTARATTSGAPSDATASEFGTYSSPPCFMHELDPAFLGFASTDDEGLPGPQSQNPERTAARGEPEMPAAPCGPRAARSAE